MNLNDLPGKKRPLASVRAMNQWIRDAERQTGLADRRIAWIISSTVIVAALQRALDDDKRPLFWVKGGVLVEFQLGQRARATQDIDALFRGTLGEFEASLDEALAQPWGPFTLERTPITVIHAPKLVQPRRFDVKLIAKGAIWRRVQVEISFPEGKIGDTAARIPAPNVGFFGLSTPDELLGIGVDYQIAQKIHACTEPDSVAYENQRPHDIAYILLLKDRFFQDGQLASLKAACLDTFEVRAAEAVALGREPRPWPPVVVANDYWVQAWPDIAGSVDLPMTLDEAVATTNAWIAAISEAEV